MSRRFKLHEMLCDVLGSKNVYFQPPANLQMIYPAIVYSLDKIQNGHADDGVYLSDKLYKIVLIDKNPDNVTVDKINQLPRCSFNTSYTRDNLNHYVFSLYF